MRHPRQQASLSMRAAVADSFPEQIGLIESTTSNLA
jgi:hypothetical protein